jgi:dsRNA-specific ribonuclease
LKFELNSDTDLSRIFEYLSRVTETLKDDYDSQLDNEGNKLHKIEKLTILFAHFRKKHEEIQSRITPKIEETFNVKIKNPNLITVALYTPSTKNSFVELSTYIEKSHPKLYDDEMFEFMIRFGDIAQGLATLGDSALKLSLTHILWNEGIIEKGKITKAKERIEQNSNLSKYCDTIELYEHRIFIKSKFFNPKPSTIKHIKGTLIESLLGIYYLEAGFMGVRKLVKSLEDQQKEFDELKVES